MKSIIEAATDKNGVVNMDLLLLRYSNPKSSFMIDMIMQYIRNNNLRYKLYSMESLDEPIRISSNKT